MLHLPRRSVLLPVALGAALVVGGCGAEPAAPDRTPDASAGGAAGATSLPPLAAAGGLAAMDSGPVAADTGSPTANPPGDLPAVDAMADGTGDAAMGSAGPATGATEPMQPEVSVEQVGDAAWRVTVADPGAKAWRLVASGVGELDADRFVVVVETGDVAYGASVASVVTAADGTARSDETSLEPGVAGAPICHPTLHACLTPDGIGAPSGGPGSDSASFTISIDPEVTVRLQAGVAGWPGEPFVLGPWTDAEALTLGS